MPPPGVLTRMKLRKRPAQPLNLVSVEQAGSAPSLTPPQMSAALMAGSEPQTPPIAANGGDERGSEDALASAPWPSGLADSEWTTGWADPGVAPVEAPPVALSHDPDPSAPQATPSHEWGLDISQDLDRPPLRQALSKPTDASTADVREAKPQKPAAEARAEKPPAKPLKLDRRAGETTLGLRYRPPKPELGNARYAYLAAGMGAVLWSGSFIAFMVAFQKGVAPLTYVPFQSTILAVLTILPAAFMILAAYAIRQGASMAAEARIARRLAQDMVLPAAQAASETTSVLEAVRAEVDRATGATRAALDEIAALRDALTQETDRLTEAAGDAQRTARIVGETLANERDEIAQLSRELRNNAEDIAAAVSQQTQLVADASDLARSQLQEAEATLVARAADLTAATALAGSAAESASDRLAEQTQLLDATGTALADRLSALDVRMSEQRDGLGALVDRCNEDQDEIAARLETRRAQLIDTITDARRSAAELSQSSDESTEALRDLIATAASQMRDVVQAAEAERTALSENAAETYAAVADQARYAQEAVTTHVETARVQVEQLGQLAFDAGQRANQAFEARISDARRLIEQSAALVEDAGVRSAARIEVGVAASRSALEELSQALAEVDARISKLPDDARAQADAVRVAVERAAADLAAAVRKLSLETKAVDDSFQARVRKSYEALKSYTPPVEAAKATSAPVSAPPLPQKPQAPIRRSDPADVEALRRALAAQEAEEDDLAAFRNSGSAPQTSDPADLGLRPRLRLTPTEADNALKSVFDPLQTRQRDPATPRMFAERGGSFGADRAPARALDQDMDEWTWKDLLSSIDETPATDDALAGLMIEEITALGLDAGALLPRSRLDEISATAVSMGPGAIRDTVRRLAPAAVRRLSRRVLTDKVLKDQADRYLRRYFDLLQGSIEKDPAVVNALLGSDPGRAYLLLDAAVGDLH
jgi:predicted translin family RNA/ssDNA-binding protein